MTWYLTVRALCVVVFISALGSFFAAMACLDDGSLRGARWWTVYGFAFAFIGCVLVGLGWGGEHP